MDPQDHLSGTDAESSSRHALNRPVAVPDPTPDRDTDTDTWFTVVLRGYDRAQVDARMAEMERRISEEVRRADAAESALGAARSQARRLQDTAAAGGGDERSFGVHVERVLQAAEREASDLREKAAAEAATVLDTARAEAEQHRRQTEHALLGRASTLDQEFATRAAALDARERDVDDRIATAEREAGRIREEADRAAAAERAAAEHRAADLMRHAEDTARQQRDDLSRDVDRLAGLRDQVREELSRLRGVLGDELDREPVTVADDDLFARAGQDTTDRTDVPGPGTDLGTGSGDDPRTSRLRIAPAPGSSEHPNERTAVGSVPPFTVSPLGVLPARDRSTGTVDGGRPFTSSGDTASDNDGATPATGATGARTSEDGGSSNGSATRSTSPNRGPR